MEAHPGKLSRISLLKQKAKEAARNRVLPVSPLLGKRPDSKEREREGRQKEGVGKVGRERKRE